MGFPFTVLIDSNTEDREVNRELKSLTSMMTIKDMTEIYEEVDNKIPIKAFVDHVQEHYNNAVILINNVTNVYDVK